LANTKSAQKKIRADEKKQTHNRVVRSRTRTLVSRARKSIDKSAESASTEVMTALSALDKAASKGIIHPNNAARRKSRLVKKLNSTRA
jgi:small subunit ribosomal protein S20